MFRCYPYALEKNRLYCSFHESAFRFRSLQYVTLWHKSRSLGQHNDRCYPDPPNQRKPGVLILNISSHAKVYTTPLLSSIPPKGIFGKFQALWSTFSTVILARAQQEATTALLQLLIIFSCLLIDASITWRSPTRRPATLLLFLCSWSQQPSAAPRSSQTSKTR